MTIRNSYSFSQKIKLGIWFIRTKILCKNARIIRFPFDIRGRKYIDLGNKLTTGVGCRLEAFSKEGNRVMHFGENVQMNDYVHISAMKEVRIGDNVLMAGKIYISDNSHGFYKGTSDDSSPEVAPIHRSYRVSAVHIEENVWIGEGVTIMPGVTIGKGAVIGANSVVTKNIPAFSIAVGNPAKVIKMYDFETKSWRKIS